jgi:hypothetical protein
MVVLLMKPTTCTWYCNNHFTLLSYVVISFKLFSIQLFNYNYTYTHGISSTHIQDTTHHEVPTLTPDQDHTQVIDNGMDVANDDSVDNHEFTNDEDGFVMITRAAMLS